MTRRDLFNYGSSPAEVADSDNIPDVYKAARARAVARGFDYSDSHYR